jgi:CHAD domain-containing protein
MAKARPIPDLDGAQEFRAAAARVVEVRAAEVWEHAADVLDTQDIERVHDMRVATRRLRAVLEIFAPCFPKPMHRDVLREIKRLADALGERRDPDVQISYLEGYAAAVPQADRPGVEMLTGRLRARQGAANASLAATLAEVERGDLQGRVRALVEEARGG